MAKVPPPVHCQICGRPIMAKSGYIAHHGYRRPGYGWQTGSCPGARHVPFEKGKDAIDGQLSLFPKWIDDTQAAVDKFIQNPPAELAFSKRDAYGRRVSNKVFPKPEGFVPNDAISRGCCRPGSYEDEFLTYVFGRRRHIKELEEYRKLLIERLAEWHEKIEPTL